MPAVRLSRRRRSSIPVKPGYYGIQSPPRPLTFAPNVTPVTYVAPEDEEELDLSAEGSPAPALFPPSELPHPTPARRRVPPGKRRSMGYIPRPPNAFMLFRADFVRQKHVPGSIETNHGSLSKIIGNCWRALPLEEKHVWEVKAKHAKAEHKARYPEYRFRPVHNKNKKNKIAQDADAAKDRGRKKDKSAPVDERRCEEVAQLLLEGKKGDELAAAVRRLDQPQPVYPSQLGPYSFGNSFAHAHRRSSSVPLPNVPIALPSLPFLSSSSFMHADAHTRPASPMAGISSAWAQRRASSARPASPHPFPTYPLTMAYPNYSYQYECTFDQQALLARDPSPLPEVDTSLFDQGFAFPAPSSQVPVSPSSTSTSFSFSSPSIAPEQWNQNQKSFNFSEFLATLPPHAVPPHDFGYSSFPTIQENGAMYQEPFSYSYSNSPASSDSALPQVHAPQPQRVVPTLQPEVWEQPQQGVMQPELLASFMHDGSDHHLDMTCAGTGEGIESLFEGVQVHDYTSGMTTFDFASLDVGQVVF